MNKKDFKSTGADLFLSDRANTLDDTAENEQKNNVTSEIPLSSENIGVQNLLDEISKPKLKHKPLQQTFYLDDNVINELIRLSQKSNKSKSVFLNELLRRIFFS